MNALQTVVSLPPKPSRLLSYGEGLVSLGSCFSQHIGERLRDMGHRAVLNPYGMLYNPASIALALERLLEERCFTADDLFEYGGLWHSPMHHGAYSTISQEETLRRINRDYERASLALRECKHLFLTWGTAFVYTDKARGGRVVANCHKRPEVDFERRRMSVEELTNTILPMLHRLLERQPELQIITTLSPIRHHRDGAHGNALSKATLLLMDEALRHALGDACCYFPAYEIVLDELRDYRFYAEDMAHPAPLAVKLIGDRFVEWFVSAEAQKLGADITKLKAQYEHRPLHPDHPSTQRQAEVVRTKLNVLLAQYPHLDLSSWYHG